jgi:hypothetical protein
MYIWCSLLVAILLAWVGYKAYLANRNLVTLNVRNAEVRDVVRKIEWQTWETIVVNKDVKGKVTFNVRRMPLEEVLGIIADQTSSRSLALYPIYSKGKSIVNLRKFVRGDLDRAAAGWTNFTRRGFGGRGGPGGGGGPGGFGGPPGGFGDTVRGQNSLVTLNVAGKDLGFAALALSRFARAQVVPEDGASATVSVSLRDVSFRNAVAKVAKAARMKSDVFYALEAQPDFARDEDGDRRRGRGDGQDGEGRGRFRDSETNREARAEQWAAVRQRDMEATLATMTPEEQAKMKEEQQKMEEIRNLPPDEQRQRFEQMMNDPTRRQRMESRANNNFKYSTPDQKVERARRTAEMRARREQQQQSGRR